MSYLALDVGDRRIGIAVADPDGIVVTPITTLTRKSDRQVVTDISKIIADRSVARIIVGMPYTPQGRVGEQAQRVLDFASRLESALRVEIVYWDERYSTQDARDRLSEAGVRRRPKRGQSHRVTQRERLDAAAAAVILQDYLDAHYTDVVDRSFY